MSVNVSELEDAFTKAVDERCRFGQFVGSLPEDVRESLQEKIDNEVRYSAAVIARVLKQLGYKSFTPHSIAQHRKHQCKCPEPAATRTSRKAGRK